MGFCTQDADGVLLEQTRNDGQLVWLAGEWGRQSEHGRTFRIFGAMCERVDDAPRRPLILEKHNIAAWCDPRTPRSDIAALTRESNVTDYRLHPVMVVPLTHAVLPAGSVG
jgi:putative SOS response-associated peptidase YedK